MANWLFKTEPTEYAFADLARAGRGTWDGVTNALALIHLRAVKPGDTVLVYHTGKERAAVGTARVTRGAYPDPKAGDPKLVVVDLEPEAALPAPVPLAAFQADPLLAKTDLVRLPRLSVLPLGDAAVARVKRLSAARAAAAAAAAAPSAAATRAGRTAPPKSTR